MESFLIVDDERLMRDTLKQLLSKEGYEITTAADGYEAIEFAEARVFDFIICDVRMPSIDGIETIRRVKEIIPGIRSIIITGFASQETPVKALKLGVDDYIFKPFELDEFLHSIKRNVLKLRLERENANLQKKIVDAKERLERIIDTIHEGFLLVDQDFKPTLVNEGIESIFDMERFAILENRCYETLFHTREVCADCPLRGGRFRSRRVMFRIGGKPRTLWIDGFLIEHEQGQKEMVHVARDITEWENLRKDKERSEKLAAVGQLAAGVAHEIRNPLGAINTAIGILTRARDAKKEDLEIFDIISREIVRVNKIIEDFLGFARPREPELRAVNLNNLAAESVKLIGAQVPGESGVKFDFVPDPGLGRVSLDEDQIRQVVWNLINNAVDILPNGGRVRVRTQKVEGDDATWAVIEVRDNGPGIDPETRERLFEPFFTTKKKGTGLGLAIVQRIVEAHRGRIELDSETGKGTTIKVLLPMD